MSIDLVLAILVNKTNENLEYVRIDKTVVKEFLAKVFQPHKMNSC